MALKIHNSDYEEPEESDIDDIEYIRDMFIVPKSDENEKKVKDSQLAKDPIPEEQVDSQQFETFRKIPSPNLNNRKESNESNKYERPSNEQSLPQEDPESRKQESQLSDYEEDYIEDFEDDPLNETRSNEENNQFSPKEKEINESVNKEHLEDTFKQDESKHEEKIQNKSEDSDNGETIVLNESPYVQHTNIPKKIDKEEDK